jgi:hypothetical protein
MTQSQAGSVRRRDAEVKVQQSWGTIKRINVAKWQDVILQGKKGHTRQLWDEPHTLHIVLQKLHAKERFKRCHVNHRATFCENSPGRPCTAVPVCTATIDEMHSHQGMFCCADAMQDNIAVEAI